jgi:hypothetical protein
MPRDGSGVYHTPAGTDGVPGRTVESAKYNINVHDVETELNSKRPIGSGGTGGSSAAEALVNLGAEQAYQVVTDYNSMVFNPGSFRSATTALNSPVAGHMFAGICYTNDSPPTPATSPAPNTNLVIEARDETSTDEPGILYVRQKKSGVWGPWTRDGGLSTGGGTLTGDIIISKTDPTLILNKPASGTSNTILGQTNGKTRWTMKLGDESPETVANGGSNFVLYGHAQDGTALPGTKLHMERSTGYMTQNGMYHSFLTLNRTVPGGVSGILGSYLGVARWQINLGNQAAETGSGAGSDFDIHLYNDAGGLIGTPLTITRNTGNAYFAYTLGVADDLSVGDTLYVTGNAGIGGTLTLHGNCQMDQGINVTGNVGIGGTLTQHGNCAMDNNITIGGQGYKPGGGSWAATSDARIKTRHRDYTAGLDAVTQLQPCVYSYNAHGTRQYIGLIAQEAETVMPEMVGRIAGEVDGVAVDDLRTLDTSALVYALVNAVRELSARLEALERAHGGTNGR